MIPPFFAQAADSSGDAQDAPWWVLILVVIALVLVIVSLVLRASARRKGAPQEPSWKDEARDGYQDARWLTENLTDEFAAWMGDQKGSGAEGSPSSRNDEIAAALQERTTAAHDHLFALAAKAPDRRAKELADEAATQLSALRRAVEERSDARGAYSATDNADTKALSDARAREVRATASLYRVREAAQAAVEGLHGLTR